MFRFRPMNKKTQEPMQVLEAVPLFIQVVKGIKQSFSGKVRSGHELCCLNVFGRNQIMICMAEHSWLRSDIFD